MWKTQPSVMGPFHIFGFIGLFAFIIGGAVLGRRFAGNKEARQKVLMYVGIFFVVAEIFKQIFMTIDHGSYNWEFFPFHICSLSTYALVLLGTVRKPVIHDACLGILGAPMLLFGSFYFIKPTAALTSPYIIMSCHSFLWHWTIAGVAVFTMVSYNQFDRKNIGLLVKGYFMFAIAAVIAAVADYFVYRHNPLTKVNMFYIGYGRNPFYPVMTAIFPARPVTGAAYIPYFLFFLVYIAIGSGAMFGICVLVKKLVDRIARR